MSKELIIAIIFMNLALLFYSIGVWSEKIQKTLKPWHLAFFYLGLICDTTGTGAMEKIAGGINFSFHTITGGLALILMLVHAIWVTVVLVKKDKNMIAKFHKFSIIVWVIWLIPFFTGAAMHML
ncbi:HsmA family protein [Clostridium perfringens]